MELDQAVCRTIIGHFINEIWCTLTMNPALSNKCLPHGPQLIGTSRIMQKHLILRISLLAVSVRRKRCASDNIFGSSSVPSILAVHANICSSKVRNRRAAIPNYENGSGRITSLSDALQTGRAWQAVIWLFQLASHLNSRELQSYSVIFQCSA